MSDTGFRAVEDAGAKTLLNVRRGQLESIAPVGGNTVTLYFVPGFSNENVNAEAASHQSLKVTADRLGVDAESDDIRIDQAFANTVFVGELSSLSGGTVAHELTHILLNTNDQAGQPIESVALRTIADNSAVETVSASRRLSEDLPSGAGVQHPTHFHVFGFDEEGRVQQRAFPRFNVEQLLRTQRTSLSSVGNNLLTQQPTLR